MKSLTKDELLSLLGTAKKHSDRDYLLFLMCFWHAGRISEILELKGCNLRDGYVNAKRKKGSFDIDHPFKQHENPLLNEKAILDKIAPKLGMDEYLFPSPYKPGKHLTRQQAYYLIQKYGQEAGIRHAKCFNHALRHTRIMLALKDGVGIENVRIHAGHKNLSSTGAYAIVSAEEACAAMDAVKL
jgi:integrase